MCTKPWRSKKIIKSRKNKRKMHVRGNWQQLMLNIGFLVPKVTKKEFTKAKN